MTVAYQAKNGLARRAAWLSRGVPAERVIWHPYKRFGLYAGVMFGQFFPCCVGRLRGIAQPDFPV